VTVDLALTPSQQLLVSAARAFLDKRCPLSVGPGLALDARSFRRDLWQEIGSLGWTGLLVPEALGGSAGSLLDVMLLVEEMGWACFPGPFIPSAVVSTSILLEAAADGRGGRAERLLAELARGDALAAPAILEESAALEPGAIEMRAEGAGHVTGRKLFVPDAHVASALIAVTRTGDGLSALLIEPGRRGVRIDPMPAMAGEELFAVTFDRVETSGADVLGPAGRGWDMLLPALRRGALARCAEMVGSAQRILELAVEHARVRVQSGRPIGAFQAIQHACADLFRDVEGARWIAYQAAWKVEQGPDAGAGVAMAKAHAAEACLRVARRAHQIMGAIGYCEEHPLHLLHKRILAASLDGGDATAHLDTVADAIGLDRRADAPARAEPVRAGPLA
jgi:alkylation response protein AidB-like acyl-CoA dehydrogenase